MLVFGGLVLQTPFYNYYPHYEVNLKTLYNLKQFKIKYYLAAKEIHNPVNNKQNHLTTNHVVNNY